MKTGVILELRAGRAVVLDGSGGFREVEARPEWRTGDVVPLQAPRGAHRWALPLCACLALVLVGGGGWLWTAPAALVSLDVNPAVELTLNRFDRVVGTRAMNDEGAGLLDTGSVKGMTAERAVAALLGSSYLDPYLDREGTVTLTVQTEDAALEQRLLAAVDATASGVVAPGTQVSCHGVDAGTVEAAHRHGVTAGKYLALLELQQADPNIDISAYTHCGIGEIEAQTERCHAAHGGGMEGTDGDLDASGGESCGAGEHHGDGHH